MLLRTQSPYPPAVHGRVVVWGLLAAYPFGGMTWQVMHYLAGLRRLGFDVWYVEDSDTEVRDPETLWPTADYRRNVEYLAGVMEGLGLAERWIFRPPGEPDKCLGAADRDGLVQLYRYADAAINLCGSHRLREEQFSMRCLIYMETDPVPMQVAIANGKADLISHMENYHHLFTYAENIGAPDCRLPVEHFTWHTTRPPVCVDWWDAPPPAADAAMTTVARWQHSGNDVIWQGEQWRWSKHHEFRRFVDLPARTSVPMELAVTAIDDDEAQGLRDRGWRLRAAEDYQAPERYADYIRASLGEFTATKEQYVKPRTGWFSDRSVCYLAAGRPVITQDTGFDCVLPVGEGLFGFNDQAEALAAIEVVAADYPRHSAAAAELAREYFDAERVTGDVMRQVGLL